ncbi:MAG: hypothetical protein JXA89_25525 [Anaerolineae bacterium]|nr:hypothetical protein [Anaerolineae bacterium]
MKRKRGEGRRNEDKRGAAIARHTTMSTELYYCEIGKYRSRVRVSSVSFTPPRCFSSHWWCAGPYWLLSRQVASCCQSLPISLRLRRVSHLTDARLTEETFARPADFDLAAFWQLSCAEFEQSRPTYFVIARIAPHFVVALPRYFDNRIRDAVAQAKSPDREG